MPGISNHTLPTETIIQAFKEDGWQAASQVVTHNGQRGIEARGWGDPQDKRRAFYVEGTPREMGYLVGYMAPQWLERMAIDYVDRVIPAFINKSNQDPRPAKLLAFIVTELTNHRHKQHPDDIPAALVDEMHGLAEGHAASPAREGKRKVTFERILALNAGVDMILSVLYSGFHSPEFREELGTLHGVDKAAADELFTHRPYKAPVMCNGFSVFGGATEDGKHYMGRDFMFPTAGIFEDVACPIIYNPSTDELPMVSVAAPGFVGAVTAMNSRQVGAGVQMVPAAVCDPRRPGVNSLLMVRHVGQSSASAEDAVQHIIEARRGVSWIYLVADGANDRSAAVETGMSQAQIDYLSYPEHSIKKLLPEGPFRGSQDGLFARWNDAPGPTGEFMSCNPGLYEHAHDPYDADRFGPEGFLVDCFEGVELPHMYFAPQREDRDDVLIATNHYVIPEMRLCSMTPVCNLLMGKENISTQWRYDVLNQRILDACGSIDEPKALELINTFYDPGFGKLCPDPYYGKGVPINGAVTLCNLTDRVLFARYGAQSASWVKISLSDYIVDG